MMHAMLKKRRGFILIASYMVIIVLIILGVAFISRSITETRIAQREGRYVQALYLAEAGIDQGLERLKQTHSAEDPPPANLGTGTYDYETVASGANFIITSEGSVGDITRTVRVNVRRDSIARYLYFTDDEHFRWYGWRIPVWFITGDYLEGPLQTNSHLHISGDPIFSDPDSHRAVKTADGFITYMHGGPPKDNPEFQNGIDLGVEPVPLPSKALQLRTDAVQGGYHFEASGASPAQITLNCNNTMTVTSKGLTNETMALPANGAVFITGGDVRVSGALSGQVCIGTNRNVVITDDVTYCDDPRLNPDSTDRLGLIAERNVVVSAGVPYHDYNDDGLGDVKVDASIMALGNSFTVENWWAGPAKGDLYVYGGIIQDYRGPVGTFDSSSNTKLSGYSKEYQHDPRDLGEIFFRYFPSTNDYVIISWQEQ